MSRLVACFLVMVASLCGTVAHALIDLPQVTEYRVNGQGVEGPWSSSNVSACQQWIAAWNALGGPGAVVTYDSVSATQCMYTAPPWGTSVRSNGFETRVSTPQCPANSTPAAGGGCQCNAGYQQNQAGTACQGACNFGNNVSSGFFDYGAQVSGSPPVLVCVAGCAAVFLGEVPAGSALVNGTKHYFAKGSYQTTGGTCTEGQTPGDPGAQPDVPADSCGPNQTMGVINGKATCVWQQDSTPGAGDAGKPAPTNEPDKGSNPPTSSTTTNNTVTNNNGSTTTTSTTVVNNGNGTQTTTTTTTNKDPSGNVTGTSTTSETTGRQTDQQQQQSKCEKNSSDTGCGGAPKDISGGGLYTPKEATVKGVLEGARDTLMASPVGSAVTGFFSVSGGGSCPRSTGTIPFINATISIDAFCSDFAALAFLIIRGALLVVAGWMAFRIAIDN